MRVRFIEIIERLELIISFLSSSIAIFSLIGLEADGEASCVDLVVLHFLPWYQDSLKRPEKARNHTSSEREDILLMPMLRDRALLKNTD